MPVLFSNPGVIDLACITTFGVNVKEGDNPIGQFGTGLKYAIAILLRHGHTITLNAGGTLYFFSTTPKVIRGKTFDVVTMRQESHIEEVELGFTTDLGWHWELWMSFRELYSNCMDEGGECRISQTHDLYGQGKTVFMVDGAAFEAIAREKDTVFLKSEPIYIADSLEVNEGETPFVFNQGIRVAEFDKPLTHTYNLKDKISLTEDRTMKNRQDLDSHVINIALYNPDSEVAEKIITAQANFYEAGLDFQPWRWLMSDEFFEKIAGIISRKTRATMNASVLKLYDQWRKRKDDEEEEKAKATEWKPTRLEVKFLLHVDESVSDVIRAVERAIEDSFESQKVIAEEV